jgi:hypothetical protein
VKKTAVYRDRGAIFSSGEAKKLFDTMDGELKCLLVNCSLCM